MPDLSFVPSDWRMEGLAIHIDWTRERYAESDSARSKCIYLTEQCRTLIEHDRVGRIRAKELEDRRKLVGKRPFRSHYLDYFSTDMGALIKRPWSVVNITGI